jgi:hypothetical protein
VSNNDIGAFQYTGDNGWKTQPIPTKEAGVAVPVVDKQPFGVAGTAMHIFQTVVPDPTVVPSPPAKNFTLYKVECSVDGVSFGTANANNSISTQITFPATAMTSNADIICTLTNLATPPVRILQALYRNGDRGTRCDVSMKVKSDCEFTTSAGVLVPNDQSSCKSSDYQMACGDAQISATGTGGLSQRLWVTWSCGNDQKRYCNLWHAATPVNIICANGGSERFAEPDDGDSYQTKTGIGKCELPIDWKQP